MAGVYVGYMFASSYYTVLALGLIYGASNGVYLAVDYALAVECLPGSGDDSAKDLALWGIAAFLGACFGPAITGPLLTVVGAEAEAGSEGGVVGNGSSMETEATAMLSATSDDDSTHYRREGYVAVMIVGMLYSFACGVVVMRVQKGGALHKHEPLPDSPSEEP